MVVKNAMEIRIPFLAVSVLAFVFILLITLILPAAQVIASQLAVSHLTAFDNNRRVTRRLTSLLIGPIVSISGRYMKYANRVNLSPF